MQSAIRRLREFKWTRASMLIVIAAIYLLTHIPLLNYVPLMRDEGLYSVMIQEQISHPTLVPTFLGYEVPWKPVGFYWIYAPFSSVLGKLDFLPIESVYRLPGTLFGLLNVFLVFLILAKLLEDDHEAFLVTLLYSSIFLVMNVDSRVLTDTLCASAMLAGILAYLHSPSDRRYLLLGGAFIFITYMIKQVNAATIIIVAGVYLFEKGRKRLFDPLFILSLASYPIAMLLFNASIAHLSPVSDNAYFIQAYLLGNLTPISLGASLFTLFLMASVWIIFSLYGFMKYWRDNLTLSAWYALTIFPLFAGTLMPWYFYPVIVPMAYFSMQFLKKGPEGKERKDDFFYLVFAMMAVTGLAIGIVSQINDDASVEWAKHTGEFLAGKDNVLIIGPYEPTLPSYKMLEEIRASGKAKDFGWISFPERTMETEAYLPFLMDYHAMPGNVTDGSFADMFWRKGTYRKDTNLTRFDYICIVGNESVDPGGRMVLNSTFAFVYDMRK